MYPGCTCWRACACVCMCGWCGAYRVPLKAVQPPNMLLMFVTWLTFHADKSSLNSRFPLNSSFMSVAFEVPHCFISPYLASAAPLSSNHSFTASLSSASLAKVYYGGE